jgi:hypothetical protein
MVKGKKGSPTRLASLSFNPVRKADIRWVEFKASAVDRVIGLITPTGRGAVAMIDYLSLLCDDPGAEGFLWIFIISEQTTMFTRIIKDKECQLLGCNHPLQ